MASKQKAYAALALLCCLCIPACVNAGNSKIIITERKNPDAYCNVLPENEEQLLSYFSQANAIQREAWVELEHYSCEVVGKLYVQSKWVNFSINASGAGRVWETGKQNATKSYFCDSDCQRRVGWKSIIE